MSIVSCVKMIHRGIVCVCNWSVEITPHCIAATVEPGSFVFLPHKHAFCVFLKWTMGFQCYCSTKTPTEEIWEDGFVLFACCPGSACFRFSRQPVVIITWLVVACWVFRTVEDKSQKPSCIKPNQALKHRGLWWSHRISLSPCKWKH